MSLRQAEIWVETCVSDGKKERKSWVISIAVLGHAIRGDDTTKEPSVHREEEGTED